MKYFLVKIFILVSFYQLNAQNDTIYEKRLEDLSAKSKQFYYTQQDSVYYYLEEMYNITSEKNQWETSIYALMNWSRQAGYFYDLQTLKSNLGRLDSIFRQNRDSIQNLPHRLLLENSLLYDKGNYYFKINNNKTSKEVFAKIISTTENLPDSIFSYNHKGLLSAAYSFMAKISSNEGKLSLAKQFYTKNIRFLKSEIPGDVNGISRNYSLLAEVFVKETNYYTANKYYIKSLEAGLKSENTNAIVTDAHHLVQNHISLSQLDSAYFYLNVIKTNLPEGHPFWHKYFEVKADIAAKNENYTLALEDYQKAIESLRIKWNNGKHEEMAHIYDKIGLLNMAKHQPKKSLINYKLGINQLSGRNANKSYLLKILKHKVEALNSMGSYPLTRETVSGAVSTLDSLRPTFESADDKLFLIEESFPIFESGLEAVYQLNKSSKDETYIDIAFGYEEKSKSVLLLEALLATKATQFSSIPDNLLERERQLKSEITFIEKQLNKAKEADNEKEDQLFDLQEEHRQLINKIETNYKTYYDLKYNTKTVSLSEAQKQLNYDEKLISYFYGNDAIYAIAIDKTSKQFERIPLDTALENTIKQVHQMLGDSKSEITKLAETSYSIYSRLVAPFIVSGKKKKLIIITDGLLNYIPFGALNTEENGLSYLVEKYAISYANSATLKAQLSGRSKNKDNLLAFAPSFSGEQVQFDPSRDNLLPLPHNKREVEQILTSFKGQSFINQKASLQNFTSQLSNFGILHLATHAVFDDSSPEYSYLAFSTIDNKENLLYVSDLYNLQIDADLVTLSACETGVGELKRGEGFLSLARGFFYSGASSIASTLWKVNDASTTTLMDSFYKNLSHGLYKDLALQNAKKSFLKTNRQNGLSHPYYWSGFIISGNITPLTSPNYWVWITLGILLCAVAGFLIFGKKKES